MYQLLGGFYDSNYMLVIIKVSLAHVSLEGIYCITVLKYIWIK